MRNYKFGVMAEVKKLDFELAEQMVQAGIKPKVFGPKTKIARQFYCETNRTGSYVYVHAFGDVWLDSSGTHFVCQEQMGGSTSMIQTFDAVVNGCFAQINVLISLDKHARA